MVIFAVIMPLVILIILGIIYGTNPAAEGAEYTFLEQSFRNAKNSKRFSVDAGY